MFIRDFSRDDSISKKSKHKPELPKQVKPIKTLDVIGGVRTEETVRAVVPTSPTNEPKTNNVIAKDREEKRFKLEVWTFVFVVVVALLSSIQSCQAIRTAHAALEANQIAKDNLRTDERPYMVRAPMGTPSELIVVPSRVDAGRLRLALHMVNYGKSPAVINSASFRIYVGSAEISAIGLEKRDYPNEVIVPSGDKPVFWAFSRRLTDQEITVLKPSIYAAPWPIAVSGSIEYTDIFPGTKPSYSTGLCGELASNNYDSSTSSVCSDKEYLR